MMADVTVDISPESRAQLAQLEREMLAIPQRARVALHASLPMLTRMLADQLEIEFARHNKTGTTMDSMDVDEASGHISIGGGAPYVEFGFPPHVIDTNQTRGGEGYLHWASGAGSGVADHWAKKVFNPGYGGDDFVGRAMLRINLDPAMAAITDASWAGVALLRSAHGLARNTFYSLLGSGMTKGQAMAGAQSIFASALGR